MRGLEIGHWSRWVFMTFLVVTFIDSVPIISVYASEETAPGLRVDSAKAQSVRAKFMARLEEMGDLSSEKERWFSVYARLDDGIRNVDDARREIEVKLAKSEDEPRVGKTLRRLEGSLGKKSSALHMLQELAIRQYALLSEIESIEQSVKHKTLPRAEYLRERAYFMEQITHVEQLRLWENLAGDIVFSLKEIADEVGDLEFPISTSRLK